MLLDHCKPSSGELKCPFREKISPTPVTAPCSWCFLYNIVKTATHSLRWFCGTTRDHLKTFVGKREIVIFFVRSPVSIKCTLARKSPTWNIHTHLSGCNLVDSSMLTQTSYKESRAFVYATIEIWWLCKDVGLIVIKFRNRHILIENALQWTSQSVEKCGNKQKHYETLDMIRVHTQAFNSLPISRTEFLCI